MSDESAVDLRGEVFTPDNLVSDMLDGVKKAVPSAFTDDAKTFLDNSCGDGQFLVAILVKKMESGISHMDALKTIYGVEIDEANADKCRKRLSLGKTTKAVWNILNHNIICADALNPIDKGWEPVGFYWDKKNHQRIKKRFLEGIKPIAEKDLGRAQLWFEGVEY